MLNPRICSLLNVNVGDVFTIDNFPGCTFTIKDNGTFKTSPPNVKGSSAALLMALDHPDRIWVKPMTNLDHLSWQQIDEIGRSGNARKKFTLGATKKDYMKNGFVAVYRIIGFNHDDLVSGGKSPISWEMLAAYKDSRPMQADGTSVTYGESDMFKFLENDFGNLVSDELAAVAKPVYKLCADRTGKLHKVVCRFWLKSEQELFGRKIYSYGKEGHWYEYYQQEDVPYYAEDEDGDRVAQWLRSAYYDYDNCFCYVNTDGSAGINIAHYSLALLPGFNT